jgi:hypothetical protein
MMIIALDKKCNAPIDLDTLLHSFSGDMPLASLMCLLLSASRSSASPSS